MESDEEKENERLWTTVSSPRKLRGSKQTNSNDTQLQPSRRTGGHPETNHIFTNHPSPNSITITTRYIFEQQPEQQHQIKPSPIILHESSLKQTVNILEKKMKDFYIKRITNNK
ncbi:hypothetical protein K0M31_002235 [Melipona bicolor]|uniref:Uncharacterized protein n=1 Tax=Melipona bicolor TaxID=60889 RepID=A0AA40GH44_9HYME|nr:hypothetical protein K0M31_002235 [Melipona bicolor]